MSLFFGRSVGRGLLQKSRRMPHGGMSRRRNTSGSAESAPPKGNAQAVKNVGKVVTDSSCSKDSVYMKETNVRDLGNVERHGRNDACITLNVGGKEFYTLRSTVNSNAVLADHVARAEANHEITKNGAIFIDRDPANFGYILSHLRNRVENTTLEYFDKKSMKMLNKSYIDLPKDKTALRELYVEATFYQIPELQQNVCSQSWLTNLFGFFSTNSNPFDAAAKVVSQVRASLLTFGALGGTFAVTMQEEWDWLLKKIGIRDDDSNGSPAPAS